MILFCVCGCAELSLAVYCITIFGYPMLVVEDALVIIYLCYFFNVVVTISISPRTSEVLN